jgi:serine kinase of HPr protein (carbohydrate metabolism regulator)
MSHAETGETGLHATAVIFGEDGVLILGRSGTGKSALALALLARARATNRFAALVGDDRVWARGAAGRLVARGAAATAGLIERRMAGLVSVDCEPAAVVRLAVELGKPGRDWPRMPKEPDVLMICGIRTPRLALPSNQSATDQAVAVEERLSGAMKGGAEGKGISLEQSAAVHKNGKVAARLRHEGRRRREPAD